MGVSILFFVLQGLQQISSLIVGSSEMGYYCIKPWQADMSKQPLFHWSRKVCHPHQCVVVWSRSLNDAGRTTDTTHSYCITVIWTILLRPPYLEGAWRNIRTGHDALPWILNLVEASGKLCDGTYVYPDLNSILDTNLASNTKLQTYLCYSQMTGDKTYLNNTLPVLTTMQANKAEEAEEIDENLPYWVRRIVWLHQEFLP